MSNRSGLWLCADSGAGAVACAPPWPHVGVELQRECRLSCREWTSGVQLGKGAQYSLVLRSSLAVSYGSCKNLNLDEKFRHVHGASGALSFPERAVSLHPSFVR
eukprot:6680491-Prymnesium_polylepis.2